MKFKKIAGQSQIKHYLTTAVDQDRLPHALLFIGSNGFGTLGMAVATAQYLLCLDRKDGDSCGVCKHCHKAEKSIHPDIHFTFPTVGSKVTSADFLSEWRNLVGATPYQSEQKWLEILGGENKQGNITKNECDRLIKILGLKAYEGSYKVVIIWMAEYLGSQGNRILKILEEPPDNTLFILIAERQEEILNTITSRCQIVSFGPVAIPDIASHLIDQMDAKPEVAQEIAQYCDGDIVTAFDLINVSSVDTASLWLEWMRLSYKGRGPEVIRWTEKVAKASREAQKAFMKFGLHFLREMLYYQIDDTHYIRLPGKEAAALRKMSKLLDLDALQEIVQMVEENIFHLERNISSKILFLDSSIRLHYLFRRESNTLKVSAEQEGIS